MQSKLERNCLIVKQKIIEVFFYTLLDLTVVVFHFIVFSALLSSWIWYLNTIFVNKREDLRHDRATVDGSVSISTISTLFPRPSFSLPWNNYSVFPNKAAFTRECRILHLWQVNRMKTHLRKPHCVFFTNSKQRRWGAMVTIGNRVALKQTWLILSFNSLMAALTLWPRLLSGSNCF